MKLFFILLSIIAITFAQLKVEKSVILSSMYVTDKHEDIGDPQFILVCQNVGNPNINVVEITINDVYDSNKWYVVEQPVYDWDPTKGTNIICQLKDDGLNGDTLGTTQTITYDSVSYEGIRIDTTNPAEASFYLRCGNCNTNPAGDEIVKQIGVKSIKISDTTDSILADSDIYMKCMISGTSTIFRIDMFEVDSANVEYTLNRYIKDFSWNNKTMLNGATCGIFEEDNGEDDALGTFIIHFNDITPQGFTYVIPDDSNTVINLFDCQGSCSHGSVMKMNNVLLFIILLICTLMIIQYN